MNEHTFIKAIHRKLPANVCHWKIHDTFCGGVPDALYMNKRQVWIEYKYIKELPIKTKTPIRTTISPLQINWLNRLNASGGKAVLVIGCKNLYVLIETEFAAVLTKGEFEKRAKPFSSLTSWITEKTDSG